MNVHGRLCIIVPSSLLRHPGFIDLGLEVVVQCLDLALGLHFIHNLVRVLAPLALTPLVTLDDVLWRAIAR